MPATKNVFPEDKTILKTADEVAKAAVNEERASSSKQFVPYLIVVDGPKQGTRFQLREGDNLIGRSVTSVAMLEDQSVSRKHAVLTHNQGGWSIRDGGSKNGTFVNGQKTKDTVNIGHGDILQFGIYAMRLITKPTSSEEEMAPLPPDIEGKTVMIPASQQAEGTGSNINTRTMVEGDTSGFKEEELKEEDAILEDEAKGENLPEPQEIPEKKRSAVLVYLGMGLAILVVAVVGGYTYWKFLRPTMPPTPPKPTEPQVVTGQQQPVAPVVPKSVPVFLDFASSPFPAKIIMGDKDYGLAPVKVNVDLEVGKTYNVQGIFTLDELQDTRTVNVSFTVAADSTVIPILFKGQIGILKVTDIPRDTQLYLEGKYTEDPFKPHTAKLSNVVFGKPVYIPFGKYSIELRQPKQLAGSNQFIEDIRFKREFQISEDSPMFEVSVTEDDLQKFPVDIRSVPDKADVFMDGKMVGQTPYMGLFPLGPHSMTLRKDGYFEYKQDLNMDINTVYQVDIPLKTTLAGQYVNAGNALMAKGLYKDAIAQFAEAFKNSPTARETAQIQYLLGSCYLRLGDFATSAGYFEQSRQNEDFKYPSMLGLATIYGAQKDMNKALPLLVEVMIKGEDEALKRDATAVFKQISPLRSVMYIYTDPAGATVVVNDKPVAQKTPLILHDLGLGNYKIRIQKDGFVSQDLSINMSVAEFNPIIIKLKPVE